MIRRLAAKLLVRLAAPRKAWPPYAFHDRQGRAYYAWSDLSEMPRLRRLEVDAIMLMIDAGRPDKSMKEIGGAIKMNAQKAAESKNAKDRSEANAAVFKLADELLMRSTLLPEECYYMLAAATCVREDEEDPNAIDRKIHADKVEAFRLAGRAGHAFFTTPIQRALLGPLYTTDAEWQRLLLAWIAQEARERAVLKVLTSETK